MEYGNARGSNRTLTSRPTVRAHRRRPCQSSAPAGASTRAVAHRGEIRGDRIVKPVSRDPDPVVNAALARDMEGDLGVVEPPGRAFSVDRCRRCTHADSLSDQTILSIDRQNAKPFAAAGSTECRRPVGHVFLCFVVLGAGVGMVAVEQGVVGVGDLGWGGAGRNSQGGVVVGSVGHGESGGRWWWMVVARASAGAEV